MDKSFRLNRRRAKSARWFKTYKISGLVLLKNNRSLSHQNTVYCLFRSRHGPFFYATFFSYAHSLLVCSMYRMYV